MASLGSQGQWNLIFPRLGYQKISYWSGKSENLAVSEFYNVAIIQATGIQWREKLWESSNSICSLLAREKLARVKSGQ